MIQCESIPRKIWVHPLNHLCMEKGEFLPTVPRSQTFSCKILSLLSDKSAKIQCFVGIIETIIRKKSFQLQNANICRTTASFNLEVTNFPICIEK